MDNYWMVYEENDRLEAIETENGAKAGDIETLAKNSGLPIIGWYNGGTENDAINYFKALGLGR